MDVFAAVVAACWGLFGVVWIAAAFGGAADRSPSPVRAPISVPLAVIAWVTCALIVLVGRTVVAPLIITNTWVRITGLGILGASTAFAMWARGVLGSSWSIGPQVGGDRRLRTRGPYAITRHPIYTGVFGMLIGTAIAVGGGVALVLIGVGLVALETKIRMEEPLLVAQFPNEYPAYRARVPQLIPGLRRRRGRAGEAGD